MTPRIVDLSLTIHDRHCRWHVERILRKSYERGDALQATSATINFHGFTHMDAPRHFDREGATTSDITPEMTIGPACVIDLRMTKPNTAITVADLEASNIEIRPGDIALLRTNWDKQRSIEDLSFWTDAPWLDIEACRWLRS